MLRYRSPVIDVTKKNGPIISVLDIAAQAVIPGTLTSFSKIKLLQNKLRSKIK